MAYFSALGGTGGTSATITVTYSEDFYGLTITATNGTTTLTKTATSSGTLVFDVSEGGTWTVSGTVEGATYYEQVDVFFEYTVPPLVALPDGSTALPVNDIQMWLKCAAIRDKTTYTTLSDVLSDTDTLIALCADSNACDYMARSTTWASGVAADSTAMLIVGKYNYCANALLSDSTWASAIVNSSYVDSVVDAKVPTMTSNTTPSGTAFCDNHSGYTTQHDAWMAFDGKVAADQGKAWASSAVNSKVGYHFTTDVQINAVRIQCPASANGNELMNFKIQYSDDGTTFTDATPDALTFITAQPSTAQDKVYVIPACGYHPYWAILAISSYSNAAVIRVCEAQFYGRTEKNYTGTVIHSAVEDSIFYMDEGTPVALCTIASGDTEDVDMESFVGQTLTLVSTVAKDPTNLSNDFTMPVRITPNITEIYLMPYGALYWWGHFDKNCEDTTTANGWALTGSNPVSFVAPTHNKNSLTATSTSDYVWSGIGTKTLVSQSLTKLNAITTGISTGQFAEGEYLNLRANSGKSAAYATTYVSYQIKVSAMTKTTANVSATSTYSAFIAAPWRSSGTIHAFWLE